MENYKKYLWLHIIIMLYTVCGVMAKFASGYEFLSKQFIFFYSIELIVLFVYAIMWQQIIKKFTLSTAYANKAIGILWTMLWAVVIFKESITLNNILGSVIVIIGIIVVVDYE